MYKYVIKFNSINDEFNEESESSDFSKHLLHSMISLNLNIQAFHSIILIKLLFTSFLYSFDNKMWKEKQSYRTKTESTEELEPAENIELGDKGMLKLKYKSIKQLRDFFLDGTEVEVIERKVSLLVKKN